MKAIIRPATEADVPRIVQMARRFLATVYPGKLSDNPERLAVTAAGLIAGASSVIFVADVGDDLIGMVGFMVYEHPMSGDVTASEVCWWVEPEARGSVGIRLLARAEDWARERHATILQMIAPTPDVAHFYERLGMWKVETVYQRHLQPVRESVA